MLMPKAHKVQIYEHLFKEGVLVAERDLFLPKHPELQTIPNLHVIKTLQSLKSRGYVEENFAWRHFYWRLTNEGIQYLRDFLHLPAEIVPATLKKPTRPETRPRPMGGRSEGGFRGGDMGGGRDRDAYRRAPYEKTTEAGAGSTEMEFRGGFGRGSRKPQ